MSLGSPSWIPPPECQLIFRLSALQEEFSLSQPFIKETIRYAKVSVCSSIGNDQKINQHPGDREAPPRHLDYYPKSTSEQVVSRNWKEQNVRSSILRMQCYDIPSPPYPQVPNATMQDPLMHSNTQSILNANNKEKFLDQKNSNQTTPSPCNKYLGALRHNTTHPQIIMLIPHCPASFFQLLKRCPLIPIFHPLIMFLPKPPPSKPTQPTPPIPPALSTVPIPPIPTIRSNPSPRLIKPSSRPISIK
jgi:hypothetical protein